MDENYLDNLLKGVSADEKKNNSIEDTINLDAGVDIDLSDIKDISLDELDGLDDLDLSGLELDDIDFDDVDITKLDSRETYKSEDEDFSLDELLESAEDNSALGQSEFDDEDSDSAENPYDVFSEADNSMADDLTASGDIDSMDIDDLFSALGISSDAEKASGDTDSDFSRDGSAYTSGEEDLDSLFAETAKASLENGDLSNIEEVHGGAAKREKRKLSEIIFGVPDEEELAEEQANEQKRAERKEAKAKKKEEKQAKKNSVLEAKKKASDSKKKNKDNIKKEKLEALKAEAEEEKNEKKVPWPVVITVFAVFAVIAVVVILGSNNFNYTRVIHKAADYFERQKYHMAYDEVSGVEVKAKDEELRDRIYTVMYVERLYESYENNMAVNRPDKALDALIRGLEKYDEHYEEAVTLGIEDDINSCRTKIITALNDTYGISESYAYEIMSLTGQEYTSKLAECSEALETGE